MAISIKATDIRPGTKIAYKGDIWVVMESIHRTPGNLRAYMQVRMRSLTGGQSVNERFRAVDQIELVDLDNKTMQYLYRQDDMMAFMDTKDFEQLELRVEDLGDAVNFLIENMEVNVQFHEGKPLGVDLPPSIVMKVTETEPGVKGDTVNNVLKPATTETGYVVQVPLFVNEGEEIKVDTRTGKYISRA